MWWIWKTSLKYISLDLYSLLWLLVLFFQAICIMSNGLTFVCFAFAYQCYLFVDSCFRRFVTSRGKPTRRSYPPPPKTQLSTAPTTNHTSPPPPPPSYPPPPRPPLPLPPPHPTINMVKVQRAAQALVWVFWLEMCTSTKTCWFTLWSICCKSFPRRTVLYFYSYLFRVWSTPVRNGRLSCCLFVFSALFWRISCFRRLRVSATHMTY